jgi:outer membrane receptor protein involved in Fe transport
VSSVFAQETIDEITVTADFRARSELDIPSSISVLDKIFIEKSSTQHFQDLIYNIPNLNWSGDGNRPRYFQIRGIGELEQYQGAPNPSVGFLIDDIDYSGIGSIATLFDIEQIEILRGPQSGRYGANALAGLIYMQSVTPTEDFSSKIQLRVAEDNESAAGLAFGGPVDIFNNAKYRVSMHRHQSDGFRDNAFLNRKNTNQRKETSLRGKLIWNLADDWFFDLTTMFVDIDNGYDAFSIDNSMTMLSDKPGKDAQQSSGASMKVVYTAFNSHTVELISSLAHSKIDFSYDADWGNDKAWAPITYDYETKNNRKRQTISQEIRFISTDQTNSFINASQWLFGLHLSKLDDDLITKNTGIYNDPIYVYQDSLNTSLESKYSAISLSSFGQLNFNVNASGLLTFGLRMENRSVDYNDTENLDIGPSEFMTGGDVTYMHNISDNANGYITLSQSYKAGGFNLGVVPKNQRKFNQEKLINLEVGIKSIWDAGRIRFNGSLFYNRREDQQIRTSMQLYANDPSSFIFFTGNAAKGKSIGSEVEVRWTPNDRLELYYNAGLLRAKIEQYIGPDTNLNNRDAAHAPTYTMSTGWEYRYPSGIFMMMSASASDEFYFDVSHNQKSNAFELINARLGFEKDNWSIQLWGKNLTDRDFSVRGFYFGNEPPDFPSAVYTRLGDPRQIGLTFDMRF